MTHAFALLFFIASLVLGFPAVRRLLYMRGINRNPGATPGNVTIVRSSLGWLWTAGFGNVTRTAVSYVTPSGTEMVLEVAASSMFTFRRYEAGTLVEVVYDRASPGKAYARPEWIADLREFRIAAGFLILALVLELIARVYHI